MASVPGARERGETAPRGVAASASPKPEPPGLDAAGLLHGELQGWAARTPDSSAVTCGPQSLSYAELEQASRCLALRLVGLGVAPGDRVGLLLPPSLDAVVAVYGVLRAGGTYVPVDPQSPASRQLAVLADCSVRGVIGERSQLSRLADTDRGFAASFAFILGRALSGFGPAATTWDFCARPCGSALPEVEPQQLAYILYTSGSTGQPKGVSVTHQGARAFVDWAVRTFQLDRRDCLANQAQLSFDLSVLDLFASLAAGAKVTLIAPQLMMRPQSVCELLCEQGVTTWYSVPSALTLLMEEGQLASRRPPALRRVLFAGEVFPIAQLRRLMQALPGTRFFNLFGPTETNVCLWHEVRELPDPSAAVIPIGLPCDHLRVELLDPHGAACRSGQEGEICVSGPTVLDQYWNRPDLTRRAFWPPNTLPDSDRLYRTGDWARQDAHGTYWFLGRHDRLVKRRGYRIELGEVESALQRHPGLRDAAVWALPNEENGCTLMAAVVPKPGIVLDPLAVKLHCGTWLPRYMIPDSVAFLSELPRTNTGKVDWQTLQQTGSPPWVPSHPWFPRINSTNNSGKVD
ncbi:amino acid adenylation domain-containing protein [Myxococcota bacterium]